MRKLILSMILLCSINFALAQFIQIERNDGSIHGEKINQISNITFVDETVTDIDGNVYNIVLIGNQYWMAENLKVTKYRNGILITDVWAFNNDEANVSIYGRLYSWNEVNKHVTESDPEYNIAPVGWHVPTDTEWEELAQFISDDNGGYSKDGDDWNDVGTHLKSTTGWYIDYGTDDYDFSALPAGCYEGGSFWDMGYRTYFWSTTESSSIGAWNRYLYDVFSLIFRDTKNKVFGYSIRCVRD